MTFKARFGFSPFRAFEPKFHISFIHRIRCAAQARRQYLTEYKNPLDFNGGEILHSIKQAWWGQRFGHRGRSQSFHHNAKQREKVQRCQFWSQVVAARRQAVAACQGRLQGIYVREEHGFAKGPSNLGTGHYWNPYCGFWQASQRGEGPFRYEGFSFFKPSFEPRFGGHAWNWHYHSRFSSAFAFSHDHFFCHPGRHSHEQLFRLFLARRSARRAFRLHLRQHRDHCYYHKQQAWQCGKRSALWHMQTKAHNCCVGERTKYLGSVKVGQSDSGPAPSNGVLMSTGGFAALLAPGGFRYGRFGYGYGKGLEGRSMVAVVQSLLATPQRPLLGAMTFRVRSMRDHSTFVKALRQHCPPRTCGTRQRNERLRLPPDGGSLSASAIELGDAELLMQASLVAPLSALLHSIRLPKGPYASTDALRAMIRASMSLLTPLTAWSSRLSFAALLVLVPLLLAAGSAMAAMEEAPFTGRKRMVALTGAELAALETAILPPRGCEADERRRHWVKVVGNMTRLGSCSEGKTLMGFEVLDDNDWRTWWVEGVLNMVTDAAGCKGKGAYDVLVLEKEERNAFGLGFAPPKCDAGEAGCRGVIVVYSGILDAILNSTPPPSTMSSPPASTYSGDTDSSMTSYHSTLPSTSQTHSLALLLSHELAHLILSHPLESLSRQKAESLYRGLLSDALVAMLWPVLWMAGPWAKEAVEQAAKGFHDLGCEEQQWWTRTEVMEKEADEVGLRLMVDAGFDPRLAATGWGLEHNRFHSLGEGAFFLI